MISTSLGRAREMWAGLARVPVAFPLDGVNVVVSPESWLCPPKWAGVVVLGGAAIATVPDGSLVEPLRDALRTRVAESAVDLDRLRARLDVVDLLGPATLAYLDAGDFRMAHEAGTVDRLPVDHPAVRALVVSAGEADADESGLEEVTSEVFAVRDGEEVIAAAGYRSWPASVAHLSVLTAPRHRGHGLARRAASAAVEDALEDRLLPQWRARPEPSRRVARALGFGELGVQFSVRLGPVSDAGDERTLE
ncbi:GNAT family N-acetyltransferase [Streptosporangium sp. CA-135522]|uniref:GNAT family N-acetyltransferase n=1 Tax=Streptosporangium sp. CA-135522 TaxID=3240072 RepID=UPI003D8E592A